MAFDPTKPVDATKIVAAELRGQFNALKEIVDAALADSARNNGVAESAISPSDPPTAANFLELQSKLNELIVALRR